MKDANTIKGAQVGTTRPWSLAELPSRAFRRLQSRYRSWFQNRCNVYVHRGPFPMEQRSDCTFARYDRFEDVPQLVRDALIAYSTSKELEMDALELRDNAVMWVASCGGVAATVLFTRQARHFRRWFLPLEGNDVVLFRLRTYPEFRGRGLAPSLMRHALHECMEQGGSAYVDCKVHNHPSIRSITKTGFTLVATMKPITREEALGKSV